MKRFHSHLVAAALAAGVLAPLAHARPDAEMPAITLPITATSMATQITTVGVTVLTVTFGVIIAFSLARKILGRLRKAI